MILKIVQRGRRGMRGRIKAWVWGVSMAVLMLWPVADGWCAECLAPSPALEAGKDPFGPISVRELTPAEQDTIKGLLTSLDGEWQGKAQQIYCRDIKDPQDRDVDNYTAKADVDVDYYGNFFIQVDLYNPEKRVSRRKTLRLHLTQKKLRVNKSSSLGDVELTTVSDTSIALFYRLLHTLKQSKGSTRKEYAISLEHDGDNLIIRQLIYTQGRLSHQQRWDLSRR